MAVLLKLEHVSKSFGGIKALSDVSLELNEGEKLAIIGPNGAGKTTLLNIINGVYRPDSGKVIYLGSDITNVPAHKRAQMGIARAFQIPKPFNDISVKENVMISALFAGNRRSVTEASQIADKVLEMVGLKDKSSEIAGSLTSPQKKLLELARALASKPKLLLLDEIVAGMPPSEVDSIMLLVKRVAEEEGISVVALVEHVMRAVKYVDRAVFLHQGKVVTVGSPDEVLGSKMVKEIYLGGESYE